MLNELFKYIPKKLWDAVDFTEIRNNPDDKKYWIYLKEGWVAYDGGSDCTTLLEDNIKDLKAAIKTIRKI